MQLKTFLFDMGNVLVKFSHERMCHQIGELAGHPGTKIRELLLESGLQSEFERGRLDESQFHVRMQHLVEQTLLQDDLVQAGSDIFESNPGMQPLVAELSRRGYRLVLLSNTSISHFEFIQRNFGVLDHFDDFVLSYAVGALKPEPAIFEAALAKIGCQPGECFYTDDIAEYVAAGRTHGLQAEVFTDVPNLRRQLAARGITLD